MRRALTIGNKLKAITEPKWVNAIILARVCDKLRSKNDKSI